jgi:nucleotide-binding universal stress UspA family protein
MFHKILCPTDFSEGSKHALHVAVGLAIDHDAELVIAHAWYLPPLAFAGEQPFPGDAIQAMMQGDERELAAAARDATTLGAKRVTTKFLNGVPWDRISGELEEDKAYDLVVMGTQGRTGLARVMLGSVTEKLVRHAPCSVLAVRSHDGLEPFARVLCPIDFSDGSRQAMMLAGELVRRRGAITLLHVVDLPASYRGLAPESFDHVDELATHALEDWAADLRRKTDVSVTTRIEIGSPGARALAVLDEKPGFDLAIVGSHGRTGIRRLLLGSVAEKIVRHAGCPVAVARSRKP